MEEQERSGIHRRSTVALAAGGVGLALVLAACSSPPSDEPSATGSASESSTAMVKPGCEAYASYGDLTGKEISVYTSIVTPEDQPQIDSYKPFEECSGAKVNYEGSKEFEAQLRVRIQSGNAPDIAYIPQPGLLKSIVADYPDSAVPAPEAVIKNVDTYYTPAWKQYGTVDGTLYASPLGANVKSFVWPDSCHVSHPATGGRLARICSASSVRWGLAVIVWPSMSIVTVRRGRRVWTSFLMLTPVAACSSRATARAANTTILLCSVKPGSG